MTDVCCSKNLCQNKIRWSIILRYGLHILFTRRYHLPQANFDQEHFVIWKWFVYHHFCDKCSSWTQNNLPFHSITVKTPSPVNLYYCFYYYKDTVSRLQCIFFFYLLNKVAHLLGFKPGDLFFTPWFRNISKFQFQGPLQECVNCEISSTMYIQFTVPLAGSKWRYQALKTQSKTIAPKAMNGTNHLNEVLTPKSNTQTRAIKLPNGQKLYTQQATLVKPANQASCKDPMLLYHVSPSPTPLLHWTPAPLFPTALYVPKLTSTPHATHPLGQEAATRKEGEYEAPSRCYSWSNRGNRSSGAAT